MAIGTHDQPMTDGLDAGLADDRVRAMVAELQPAWTVEAIHRVEEGTEFVAILDIRTPEGPLRAVCKATTAGLVDPPVARAEPRLLEFVASETSIPVPEVYAACERHDELPAPFYLLEHVEGENYENRVDELTAAQRERICREAGRNLAELHELGPLPAAGGIGVADDELGVLGAGNPDSEHETYEDGREWLLNSVGGTLDALETGGWFPELADDTERFADLVPEVRAYAENAIPALPEPDPPTYCHTDYRYGNFLVDPETGETRTVLDWANLAAAPPTYNLGNTESLLLTPDRDPEARTAELRETFRSAYEDRRSDWTLDAAAREWIDVSLLASRLAAMACLPLWYQDATPAERDERAAEHREFVAEFL